MMDYSFSFVVPAYNCEEYIGDCLRSIIKQKYTNYKIIVVDDGSKDNTVSVVKSFDNVVLIRQVNKGPLMARLLGAAESEGDYVWFVDADDALVDDNVLFSINELLNEYDSPDVLFFGKKVVDDNGITVSIDNIYGSRRYFDKGSFPHKEIFMMRFQSMCSEVINRKVLTSVDFGDIVGDSFSVGEDRLFNLILYEKISSFTYVTDVFYLYIMRKRSSTNRSVTIENFKKKYSANIYNQFIEYGKRHNVYSNNALAFHNILYNYYYCILDALYHNSSKKDFKSYFRNHNVFNDISTDAKKYFKKVSLSNKQKLFLCLLSKKLFIIIYAFKRHR